MKIKAVSNQVDFPAMEEQILDFWREFEVFKQSLEERKGGEEFVFYDGPPFATGLPHYGHLLAGTIKDVVPRYQTMRGKYVERIFGWDCHGLPVENEMEKILELKGKRDIENYQVDRFNENCRSIVLRYTEDWEKIVTRMGRWVDFKNGYRTMDRDYMESIWWVFRTLWDKGMIYEGYKIVPYCPRCATPLSNFEVNQGYLEINDPAATVRFRSADEPNTYFLAWTTTPWTLPSNLALTTGSQIDYVKVKDGDEYYILAEARLGVYYPEGVEIVWRGKGKELEGKKYLPLFDYFAELKDQGAFQLLNADFVSTEDGTGIVHTAPGFGEDDAEVCKKYGLPEVCPVDEEARFTSAVPEYAGMPVRDTNSLITRRLKDEGKLVHLTTIKHNYPHCWRDDVPLIYRAISTWFVRIDMVKQTMIDCNKNINWTPDHLKFGRFGKWLENARDWAISRNRYWGAPLPIWRNEEGETICVGSVEELEKLTGAKVDDLHKHFVDQLTIPSPSGKSPLKRVPEVLDCWFESGSMPYAQNHYPFENKERFEANFPADFIAEGLDQTRGWFYTLVVLAAALFGREPFKNVLVNGLILAEDGQKMSKRKKNYPDPMEVVHRYGADALRLFMLGSQVVRAEDLKFSENGVREVLRNVMIPMWNALSFFTTYAELDNWTPEKRVFTPPKNVLDRWILSSLSQMVEEVAQEMDVYNLQKAATRFTKFVDDLTNWYIRRSRRRFWKSGDDADKLEAYSTLHKVLVTFAQTAAPFIPMTTEAIYRAIRADEMPISVHLCDFPRPESNRDEKLERQMELVMNAVSLGRFIRTQNSLKVRQPLSRAVLVAPDREAEELLRDADWIIKDELNVKTVEFLDDEGDLVIRSAKANFKVLGARLGKNMKEAATQIEGFSNSCIGDILNGKEGKIILSDGSIHMISANDLVVHREQQKGLAVASENGLTIGLDEALTPGLEAEGFARELVSKLQNLRKDSGLEVADRIKLICALSPARAEALNDFHEYIMSETLCVELSINEVVDGVTLDVNGEKVNVRLEKAG